MNEARNKLMQEVFEDYEFGQDITVTDTQGWESDGSDDYIKVVYVEDINAPDASMKISFHVKFYPNENRLKEACALLVENGCEIGYSPMLEKKMSVRFK